MPRLTKRTVEAVKPDNQKSVKLWDSEMKGFAVIVYPSGKRTYCVLYRNKERVKRMLKLGVHGKSPQKKHETLLKKSLVIWHKDWILQKKRKNPHTPLPSSLNGTMSVI